MKLILLTASASDDTMRRIFPFILAILLIFVIPMLMSRYGLTAQDIIDMVFGKFSGKRGYSAMAEEERIKHKRDRKEPHLSNGHGNEMMQMVSTMTIFARRNKIGLVYPGTINYKGKQGNLVLLVVTRSQVIGINCFGFSGIIKETDRSKEWTQHMNGGDVMIPNPIVMNQIQGNILRSSMDAAGMNNIPSSVVAVFTNENANLVIKSKKDVFTVRGLVSYLADVIGEENELIDPMETAKKIKKITTVIEKARKSAQK